MNKRSHLMDIRALRLRAMGADLLEWDIALMKVQANLPDTLPGQNVAFFVWLPQHLSRVEPAGGKVVEGKTSKDSAGTFPSAIMLMMLNPTPTTSARDKR